MSSRLNKQYVDPIERIDSEHSMREDFEEADLQVKDQELQEGDITLVYMIKIDGMTCVACSSTIEQAMKNEFSNKGLIEVQIALITNKMRIEFDQYLMEKNNITVEKVIEEIEMVGFGGDLIETIINNFRELRRSHSSNEEDGVNEEEEKPIQKQEQNIIKVCTLIIDGMTCSNCQQAIENHLKSLNGIVSASVSLLTHKASIQYQTKHIGIRTIISEVEAIGFSAKYEAKTDKADIRVIVNEAVIKQKRKFALCLALQIPILILMWIIPYAYSDFLIKYHKLNRVPLFVYLNAVFATVIQVVMGAQFYYNAYKSLRHKSANMDVLISLGTTAAWLYAIVLIGVGYKEEDTMHDEMYKEMVLMHSHNFEISSVLITIILLGKYLETISKKRTVDKLSQLASLKVTKANLIELKANEQISLDSKDVEIEVDLLQINDLIKIYPGGGVPIDGVVVFGKGICNESMLTGEARPIPKEISSKVFGGSTLLQGNLIVKVTKSAENSSINQIIKLVENAQNAKAPIQGVADKIAKYFVPAIIILALVTWIFWFSYAYSKQGIKSIVLNGQTRFQFAFNFGISTLVIACPCALGLATPTAVMVGTGVAATYGILIKGGDVLEKINSITTIVFDKTGTLTSGTPQVTDLITVKDHFKIDSASDDKELLYFFTYLTEKGSEHPLAKAIIKKIEALLQEKLEQYKEQFLTKEFKNKDGEGVFTKVVSKVTDTEYSILCGNDKLMKSFKVDMQSKELIKNIDLLEQEGKTVITLVVNQIPQLIICLEEAHLSKPESLEVITYLRTKMNLRIAMITGDNQHAAYKVAKHLGINTDDVVYKAYPEDKKKTVEKFQKMGERVMFVGDGINDSPVLAQADVGVAINSGAEITVHAAGIVLMKDTLYDVVNAIQISRKSFKRIKINFVWAFFYNLCLVPIAMGILYPVKGFKLDPIYAGAAMALSSISVVLSSLLLKLFRPKYNLKKYIKKQKADMNNSSNAMYRAPAMENSQGYIQTAKKNSEVQFELVV